jgi:hypothetical protein
VVTLVKLPFLARHQRVDRVELQHPDATVRQTFEEGRRGARRADTVANQVDLHTLLLLGHQPLREALANLVIVRMSLHVDVVPGGHDRGKHRLIGGRTILRQQHLVAGGQRRQ